MAKARDLQPLSTFSLPVYLQRIWTRLEIRKKGVLPSTQMPPTLPQAPLSSLWKVSPALEGTWPEVDREGLTGVLVQGRTSQPCGSG